ncbi:hypothetical protein QBC44DRAFT_365501 [Cladorrhinum sp. PSN332]|nr:hypothetical protein QBC44DRAFT_365501 [Cladorrhinum sp. PSN332]
MGMKEPRGKVRRMTYKGWEYEASYPASEQNVVLYITNKMRYSNLANLDIDEERIQAFASVYVRLHQVPKTSRERLEQWIELHEETVAGWNLGCFLNSPEEDRALHLKPRKPGVPPEAMLIPLVGKEEEQNPSGVWQESDRPDNQQLPTPINSSQKRKREPEVIPIAGLSFPAQMIQKHPEELANKSQQEYLAAEIKAAGRAFKALHSLITGEARDLDADDNLKPVLQNLADRSGQDLKRITKAAKIAEELREHMGKTSAVEEDDELEARILAKRARVTRDDQARQPTRTRTALAPAATVSRPARVPGASKRSTKSSRGGPWRAGVRGRDNSKTLTPRKIIEDDDEDDEAGPGPRSSLLSRRRVPLSSDSSSTDTDGSITSVISFTLVGRPDPEAPPSFSSGQARRSATAGGGGGSRRKQSESALSISSLVAQASSSNPGAAGADTTMLSSMTNKTSTPTVAAAIAREALQYYSDTHSESANEENHRGK